MMREFSAEFDRPVSLARMRPAIEGGDLLVLREAHGKPVIAGFDLSGAF